MKKQVKTGKIKKIILPLPFTMLYFRKSKNSTCLHFIERLGILDKYQKIHKKDSSYSERFYIKCNIPLINEILNKESDKIEFFNDIFIEYNNSPPYSLSQSKDMIIRSIEKISENYDYSNIPLIYKTLLPPHFSIHRIPDDVSNELHSIHSFDKEDDGNIDFVRALLELKKEKIININHFEILFLNDIYLVIKTIIDYIKPQKISETKQDKSDIKDFSELKNFVNIQEQMDECSSFNSSTQHRLFRDRWLGIKRILDFLYKKISPLLIGEQKIYIEISEFQHHEDDIDKVLVPTINKLQECGVVIRGVKKGIFTNGHALIVIKNFDSFDKQHQIVSELVHQIEEDGKDRFPDAYKSRLEENKKEIQNDIISIQLRKNQIKIDKNTGDIELNKVKTNLNPGSKEFNVLMKLVTNKNYLAIYKDLLGDNPTKTNKRNLSFTIRNLKEVLGILPIKTSKNKDIIKNIKKYGYKLIT